MCSSDLRRVRCGPRLVDGRLSILEYSSLPRLTTRGARGRTSSTMASCRAVGSATPSTSTARSVAAPRRVVRHPAACVPRPRTLSDDASSSSRPTGSVAAQSWNPLSVLAPPDISGDLLASVATLVLRGVLRSADDVRFVVDCSAGELVQGRVDGVTLSGERWVSPLDLTCERIRCVVGAVEIDPIALLTKQRVELRTTPVGTCEVSFDARD